MKNSVADPLPCPEKERSRQIQKDSNFRVQQNRPCQKHRIKIDERVIGIGGDMAKAITDIRGLVL